MSYPSQLTQCECPSTVFRNHYDGGSLSQVDGSGTDLETGASEIYIYGPSADVIMQAIRPVLEVWSRDGLVVDVTIRRGPIGAESETLSIG
jgi:hypothetical protein